MADEERDRAWGEVGGEDDDAGRRASGKGETSGDGGSDGGEVGEEGVGEEGVGEGGAATAGAGADGTANCDQVNRPRERDRERDSGGISQSGIGKQQLVF